MKGLRTRPAWFGGGAILALLFCAAPNASSLFAQIVREEAASPVDKGRMRRTMRTIANVQAECIEDEECLDEIACTVDFCTPKSNCAHAPLPGCVPCTTIRTCSPVDLVFVIDTSGSMRDEASVLCAAIASVQSELAGLGIVTNVTILGISEVPLFGFACIQGDVVHLLGGDVPGPSTTCPFPSGSAPFESWGPAAAIVAARFAWSADTRIMIPISDEGPCNGDLPEGCNDPGDDRDSIDHAVAVASAAGVVISPVAGTNASTCAVTLMQALAAGTGGLNFRSRDPATDLADAIMRIVLDQCPLDDSCDDGRACTINDRCQTGVCSGEAIPGCRDCATDAECDDANACTNDSCANGVCQAVSNFQSCDDGESCTLFDQCDESGECTGTDLAEIPCDDDADCFGNLCGMVQHRCTCTAMPELCVRPRRAGPEGCLAVGEEMVVDVVLGRTEIPLAAGQFVIQYDPTVLSFVSMTPGAQSDPTSPFSVELARQINTAEGTLFMAVAVPIGSQGMPGPAVLATMRFQTAQICATANVCFASNSAFPNRLSDAGGNSIRFHQCCGPPVNITGAPPRLSCPGSLSLDPPAGQTKAFASWAAPEGRGECDGDLTVACTATNSLGHQLTDLVEGGGLLPPGESVFACSAVDSCGQVQSCGWAVSVSHVNEAKVTVQLSAPMSSGPFDRCIELAFYSSCLQEPVVVSQTAEFGSPWNLPGRADVEVTIPAGQYACVTVRDPKHTLRSAALLSIVDGQYFARVRTDPSFGGNWLINGNVNGDSIIDLLDYQIYAAQFGVSINPDTTCDTEGYHADFNGDGVVNAADGDFISRSFLRMDATCCPGQDTTAAAGLSQNGAEELQRLGLSPLAADANADGVVNDWDVVILLDAARARSTTPRGTDQRELLRGTRSPAKTAK